MKVSALRTHAQKPMRIASNQLKQLGHLRGSGRVAAYLDHFVAFMLKLVYGFEPGAQRRAGL